MCRMFGMVAASPVALRTLLRDAPRSLCALSREHRDGWGVAIASGGDWTVHRSIECAAESSRFSGVADSSHAALVVAHVRQRTVGETSLANTHPFRRGRHVLAHNGTVEAVSWLLARTSRERLLEIEGETDSERLFAFLMTRVDETGSIDDGVRRATCELRAHDRIGTVNFLFSDGVTLFAFRRGRGLFFLDRTPSAAPRTRRTPSIVIASEPLTSERWNELSDGALLRVGVGAAASAGSSVDVTFAA